MSPLERDMAELAMAAFFEREPRMTTDDTRPHPNLSQPWGDPDYDPSCESCRAGRHGRYGRTTDDTRPDADWYTAFLLADQHRNDLLARHAALVAALERLDLYCQNYVRRASRVHDGCRSNGRKRDGKYADERWCLPCEVRAALDGEPR